MFLEAFEVVPFDDLMTYVYAEIRYKTELKGENVGPNDLIIATIGLHKNAVACNCRIGIRDIDYPSSVKFELVLPGIDDVPGSDLLAQSLELSKIAAEIGRKGSGRFYFDRRKLQRTAREEVHLEPARIAEEEKIGFLS